MNVPDFLGYIFLRSSLSLEDLGDVLSQKIFAGTKFGGKERSIHEEVPAIFIQQPFMGMLIVLDGYSGFEDDKWFTVHVQTWGGFSEYLRDRDVIKEKVRLDWYLYHLIKEGLRDVSDIIVMEP